MKAWWHELHQITGGMAVRWNATPALLIEWAERLEAVAKGMRDEAAKTNPDAVK